VGGAVGGGDGLTPQGSHRPPLLSHPPLTLGQLAHLLQREAALCQAVHSLGTDVGLPRPPEGRRGWFVTEWPPQVGEWAEHRNAASHTWTVTKRQALSLRNRLLGVGCEGALGRVVGVSQIRITAQVHSELEHVFNG
jgi:hypothetical protein